jgi:DNA adenine methylase
LDWRNLPDAMTDIIERLRGVIIENKDALVVIADHDGAETLYYIDPPYPAETRDRGSDYVFEMSDDDHRALAAMLKSVRGKVIVSGYPCDLYDRELYSDWMRKERRTLADGARERIEVVWMNFQPDQGEMFQRPNG